MYSSTTIANYFISKHKYKDITAIKIIKLTYLSYCWYLSFEKGKRRLTKDFPEKWKYGIVFPDLYEKLKHHGKGLITHTIPSLEHEQIDKDTTELLNKIWELYGKFGGVELASIVHQNDISNSGIVKDKDILSKYTIPNKGA